MVIDIYKHVGGKVAEKIEYASVVYSHVKAGIAKKEVVTLDFKDVEKVGWAFMAISIGALFSEFDDKTIKAYVKARNMTEETKQMLAKMLVAAKDFFNYDKKNNTEVKNEN